MNQSTSLVSPFGGLQRSLALLVRDWAGNMTLIHDRGQTWPSFGYDPTEQDSLRVIARKVDALEFCPWLALVVVWFLAFAGCFVIGAAVLASHLGPEPASLPQGSPVFDYPAVPALILAYYASARLRRTAPGAAS